MVKKMSKSDPEQYTDPQLRDRIKAEVTASDRGGNPGQWSARKAQIVAHEYEAQGGGYKHARTADQKSLKAWGDEHWQTADGGQARRPGGTARYLPEKAWEELSEEEKAATDRKKKEGSRKGKQFVANTEAAAKARRHAEEPLSKVPARSKSGKKKTARAS